MGLSALRVRVMRILFFLNALWVGGFVVRGLAVHAGPWDPVRGVAYSFWGALALLSAVGVRTPVAMIPVLLMQLVYKSIWLLAIYLPSGVDGGMLPVMVSAVVIDLAVIPWNFVASTYFFTSQHPPAHHTRVA